MRGLVLTDAKIGVFTHPHDPSLLQNRCFLYHLIGNKTGEWKVPVGGMGARGAANWKGPPARTGAEFLTNVELRELDAGRREAEPSNLKLDGKKQTVDARFLLVNFGRNVLAKYRGRSVSARCHR